MANYGDLAEKLTGQREQDLVFPSLPDDRLSVAARLYEQLKVHVGHEIEQANIELSKRKLHTLERQFLPSYDGKICLTFGPYLLCAVELDEARGRVTAILAGPPHATEISRKVFPLGGENSLEAMAAAIVSGLLMGKFI